MDVNADFSQRIVVHGDQIPWESSPMPGVDRRRLDRVDTVNERVTTIVRYAPDSHFSAHVHTGGEEFIVLEGVFEDDYGDWPVGSYVRNPPQSSHTPGSKPGCVIMVKLGQFDPDDQRFVHVNINQLELIPHRDRAGVSTASLYKDSRESVFVEDWEAGKTVTLDAPGGAELFVIDGGFSEGGDELVKNSWLRLPPGSKVNAVAGSLGTRLWVKTNHLEGLLK